MPASKIMESYGAANSHVLKIGRKLGETSSLTYSGTIFPKTSIEHPLSCPHLCPALGGSLAGRWYW